MPDPVENPPLPEGFNNLSESQRDELRRYLFEQGLSDIPRTMPMSDMDFYQQLHNPNSLLYKVYWGSFKLHFFLEILEEYQVCQQQNVEQTQERNWLDYLELLDEKKPLTSPVNVGEESTEDGDLFDDVDDNAVVKVFDSDSAQDIYKLQQRLGNQYRESCEELETLQHELRKDGVQGLGLHGYEDDETIRRLLAYQINPEVVFENNQQALEQIRGVVVEFTSTLHETLKAVDLHYAAADFVFSYIRDYAAPAAVAALQYAGDSLENASEKLGNMVPTWIKQAENMEKNKQRQEKSLEKAENSIKTLIRESKESSAPRIDR